MGRTYLMMTLILGLNWGGFAFCLWCCTRRTTNQRPEGPA